MSKYKTLFSDMVKQNEQIFKSFKKIHDKYALDPNKWQEQFNSEGREVLDIIRRYENRLCGRSKSSGYSAFSGKLAEKFREEIKKEYSKIDFIGVKK